MPLVWGTYQFSFPWPSALDAKKIPQIGSLYQDFSSPVEHLKACYNKLLSMNWSTHQSVMRHNLSNISLYIRLPDIHTNFKQLKEYVNTQTYSYKLKTSMFRLKQVLPGCMYSFQVSTKTSCSSHSLLWAF